MERKMETHPLLPSGEWEGFYTFGNNDQHKMFFSFNFQANKITGSGTDDVGPFRWKGTYDKNNLTCQVIKYYFTHQVFYVGHIDENGIWGNWTIGFHSKGGFHFWPKGNTNAEEAEEAFEEVNSLT